MRKLTYSDAANWDLYLPAALFAYRLSKHCVTGNSPIIRIDNYSSLETQAQELESNLEPRFLWAAGPVDCRTAHLSFSGIEPPQADTKHIDPCGRKSQTKGIVTPNGGLITAPNGGTDLAIISFMNLKSTPTKKSRANPDKRHGPAARSHDLDTRARQSSSQFEILDQ
ncbi:hypothetical protein DSO57_1032586 [Entomophthora muscae]|uniref:Uncharacterized protein n=1 Tax=Entomophthora muscae TaxID=34485 RepID=A0ACC2TY77_9FUNG|nr:hypothetical protein DSO57_1032586 [Entomophthora muscae]